MAMTGACSKEQEPRNLVEEYWEIRSNCGIGVDEWPAASDEHYSAIFPVSQNCSAALGDSVGLDWDDFGSAPHDFEIAMTADEGVISGLFTIIGSSMGTVGDIDTLPEIPDSVEEAIRTRQYRGQVDDADPAGVLWWYMVSSYIVSVVLSDELARPMMSYDNGTMHVGALEYGDSSTVAGLIWWPVEFGGVIAHESAHWSEPDHVLCPSELGYGDDYFHCDEDWRHAYGTGALFWSSWITNNSGSIGFLHCDTALDALEYTCARIIDPTGFTPCTDLPTCE